MQLQGVLNPNKIQQRNQSTANPPFLSTENPNKNQISLHNTHLSSNKKYLQDILLYEKYEKNWRKFVSNNSKEKKTVCHNKFVTKESINTFVPLLGSNCCIKDWNPIDHSTQKTKPDWVGVTGFERLQMGQNLRTKCGFHSGPAGWQWRPWSIELESFPVWDSLLDFGQRASHYPPPQNTSYVPPVLLHNLLLLLPMLPILITPSLEFFGTPKAEQCWPRFSKGSTNPAGWSNKKTCNTRREQGHQGCLQQGRRKKQMKQTKNRHALLRYVPFLLQNTHKMFPHVSSSSSTTTTRTTTTKAYQIFMHEAKFFPDPKHPQNVSSCGLFFKFSFI